MKVKIKNQLLEILTVKGLTQGFTLPELLITLVLSGVIFTAAAGGLVSILSTNRELEAKSVRKDELTRALNLMKKEINEASIIQVETPGSSGTNRLCKTGDVDGDCLKLIYLAPNSDFDNDGNMGCIERIVYYAFQDISSGTQTWLKPARIRRKEATPKNNTLLPFHPTVTVLPSNANSCDTVLSPTANYDNVATKAVTETDWESPPPATPGTTPSWQTIADGILGDNEHNPNPTCETGWSGPYGQNASNKGGFRFCLENTTDTNRGVQIFLYGHILSEDIGDTIELNSFSYALNPLDHK